MKQIYKLRINPHTGGSDNQKAPEVLNRDVFSWYRVGAYLGTSESWNSPMEIIVGSLQPKELDPLLLQDAKIYRFPHLTLPREKLQALHDRYNSKTIRDKEKCDIAVISEKLIGKMTDSMWGSNERSNKADYLTLFAEAENLGLLTAESISYLNELANVMNSDDVLCFEVSHYWIDGNTNAMTWIKKIRDRRSTYQGNSRYAWWVKVTHINDWNWLMANSDKLIYDKPLLKECTAGSVPLDQESYKRLYEMIISNDDENKVIGLEVMANCDVEQSKTYLGLLFWFNHDLMKYAKNWNHVNIKSLRKQFEGYIAYSHYSYASCYDSLVKKMIEDNCLTEFAVNVIASLMFKGVLEKTYGVSKTNGVFSIDPSVLVLKDKYKKSIRQEDLVPEGSFFI